MTEADAGFDLTGRVAAITGAGSGIGEASAILLAQHGGKIVCGDIDVVALADTVSKIEAMGGQAIAVQTDISVQSQVQLLVSRTLEEFGRLDVMANIAGVNQQPSLIMDTPVEELDRMLAINVKGVLFGCQAAVSAMIDSGGGSIINMASGAVDSAGIRTGVYGMSKAAVVHLTRTLAAEVACHRVRVNAISPGAVETKMIQRLYQDSQGAVDEERRKAWFTKMEEVTPLGVVSKPLDIAYAVLYLASDASRVLTGQTLRPNGGLAMPS